MNKPEYNNIAVWDLTFYRCDDDGNELKDKNGKVITYRAETNCEYLAEGLDIDDLEENEDEEIKFMWLNYYECPECENIWEDQWDCQVDDDCSECGCRHISPSNSTEIEGD